MAYDLEEQEQLAALKAWWSQYGNSITWVLVIALGAFAGWNYWQNRQVAQAGDAARLYGEQERAIQIRDNVKIMRAAADMREKYPETPFAAMSALRAAKTAVDAADTKTAKEQLQWVIDKSDNAEYKSIAKLRLAAVLLDEKAFDDALKVLGGEFPEQFAGAVADRKGDVLLAQNKTGEARDAYKLALDKLGKDDPTRKLVELKLESVGGTVEKAAA